MLIIVYYILLEFYQQLQGRLILFDEITSNYESVPSLLGGLFVCLFHCLTQYISHC